MPLLKEFDLLFERRPGVPLDDSALDDEALDLLRFGDEGGDDDFVPSAASAVDVPLLYHADVSLQEIADLHHDISPSASTDDSSDLDSVLSDASPVSSSVEEEHGFELLPRTVSSKRGATGIAGTVSPKRGSPVMLVWHKVPLFRREKPPQRKEERDR